MSLYLGTTTPSEYEAGTTGNKMTSINSISAKLDDWSEEGADPIYCALRTKYSGTWYYKTFPDSTGTRQNWLEGYLTKTRYNITNKIMRINFTFEECGS